MSEDKTILYDFSEKSSWLLKSANKNNWFS